MSEKPIILRPDGRLGVSTEMLASLSLCDVALLMASLWDEMLTEQASEILTDASGVALGGGLGMMPVACLGEYDDGLSDQLGRFLFGTEGEMLT